MEDLKWMIKKFGWIFLIIVIVVLLNCLILKSIDSENKVEEVWNPPMEISNGEPEENLVEIANESEQTDVWEKGYNLPIEDDIKNEAIEDCKMVMGLIQDIYIEADKGTASNVVLSDETMCQHTRLSIPYQLS